MLNNLESSLTQEGNEIFCFLPKKKAFTNESVDLLFCQKKNMGPFNLQPKFHRGKVGLKIEFLKWEMEKGSEVF